MSLFSLIDYLQEVHEHLHEKLHEAEEEAHHHDHGHEFTVGRRVFQLSITFLLLRSP